MAAAAEVISIEPDPLLPLAVALPQVEQRFRGALGLIVVSARPLEDVERHYGVDAYRQALHGVVALVRDTLRSRLEEDDLVLPGSLGRSEVVVICFREATDSAFQQSILAEMHRVLTQTLAAQSHRIGRPYLHSVETLPVGTSFVLRNPTLSINTQLRGALEEARSHSDLEARIDARRRRNSLMGVLVGEQVTSVYEPIVDVSSRTVFGYEALSRGPTGTDLHTPTVLFDRAVEEGLVFELDALCRRRALEGAIDLPGGTRLFLNFRPTTFHDPSFRAETLIRTLQRCRLSPSDIVFEISEQESIDNIWLFREVRDYYGALGFQIALDDTGAGYSSLSAVMELSPEFIKVDRAFVQGIDQDLSRQELLRALNAVGRRIGARTIAEGLDTIEELETLRQLEIPFGQGWLFGKATPLRARV